MVNDFQQRQLVSPSQDGTAWDFSHRFEEVPPSLVAEYYRTLMRHKLVILLTAVAFAFVGLVSHLTTQPIYRTRSSLDIQSVNSDFMNLHSVNPTAATPNDTLIQTQIKLLESDSLLDRVQSRLSAESHPVFIFRNDLLSRVKRTLHIGTPQRITYEDLLIETAAGVKIKPLGITQLIEITCDSWDAHFAASFCNTLTDEFRQADLESRGDEAKRTSDWLIRQAGDVRQKAEESEHRLIAATGGNGLILSEEANGVGEDGLRAMQGELVRAQATRMEAEAKVEIRRDISNHAPIANESPSYSADKVRLAELQTQIAALVPGLTEENTRVIHLRSEIRQIETNLDKETLESDERLQNEYAAAKHREALLVVAYNAQAGHVSSDLEKSSEVDLLRHEVQSEQQLYQTLLQRAKEAGFASAMPASTIRVVDAAKIPHMPALPKNKASALEGLLVGGFMGAILVFFIDRSTVKMRMPGDSERFLHTEELGVIPSPGAAAAFRFRLPAKQARGTLGSGLPETRHTASWGADMSLVSEAYRNLTISILNSERSNSARSYVISSPSAGEGKTTITCNIGVALSKAKLRVVLVDGDLRKPSLHRVFSLDNNLGLRQILGGDMTPLADFCQETEFAGLSVIPAGWGSSASVDLLHSEVFGALMTELGKRFDVVLVDTPPMLHMADARVLARNVQGTILVFRSGITTLEDALTARTLLSRDNIFVLGSILNDFNPRNSGKRGYYDSYSTYQRESEKEDAGVETL